MKIIHLHVIWRRREHHKQKVINWLTTIIGWFQLVCFLYVAYHAILMADHGDIEKSINWALIALIIKPYGPRIKD